MTILLVLDTIAIIILAAMIAVIIYFSLVSPLKAKKEKEYKRKHTWTIVSDNDDEVVYVNEDGDEFHQFRNS